MGRPICGVPFLSPQLIGAEGCWVTEKAERYWNLMLRYYDFAERAELPFLVDSYRKVAGRYRAMAKEAFDLADVEKTDGGAAVDQNKPLSLFGS